MSRVSCTNSALAQIWHFIFIAPCSFFCKDAFIMHRKIWMSQICHAHNCRAVQKNETHPSHFTLLTAIPIDVTLSCTPVLTMERRQVGRSDHAGSEIGGTTGEQTPGGRCAGQRRSCT